MLRSSIAFITALYAIGFAFIALTAVRWPSLLMIAALIGDGAGAVSDMQDVLNWRELGLTFGVIYLFAAFFFYTSSTLIGRRGRGSVVFYVLGAGIGFTPLFLFDFEPGWWQNPDNFEQCVLFAAAMTLILFGAVWDLSRTRKDKGRVQPVSDAPPEILLNQLVVPVGMATQGTARPAQTPARYSPVSPAIARQRACFAAYGRRARARQNR